MTRTTDDVVVQFFLLAHDIGQVVGVTIEDGNLLTLHLHRIVVPAGNQQVADIHRVLEDVHQGDALGNEIHRRHQREHDGIGLLSLQGNQRSGG